MGSFKISQLIQHNYFNGIQQLFIPLRDPHWESNKMWAVSEEVPVCGEAYLKLIKMEGISFKKKGGAKRHQMRQTTKFTE